MSIDFTFGGRLKVPLIVSPMFLVSNPPLALACCSRGVMGSFPAHSTRNRDVFANWLEDMERGLAEMEAPAPFAVNLVVHPTNERYPGDLELCIQHRVPVILTSKGAPDDVFKRIHDYGGVAFHDIASARHAEKAAEAGADALIAVCAGAGGHTGTINPFALLNEVRQVTDKPIILAGGMSTGQDILAAQAMGASACYFGTRFIATRECLSDDATRDMMVAATAKDIFFSAALDGAPANWLRPSLIQEGLDPDEIAAYTPGQRVQNQAARARYSKIKSAGQGVGMIESVESAADLCDRIIDEYNRSKRAFANNLLRTTA
ncbi:2-nitropropane dioxygenase [Hyphomonas adhaerens MHS-3]|uniref:2-nitropropane dioxygenase n=1 Tax=Hyphomonas adhaerens MHS-3 TaxID=1280949 RepID=A0A069E6X3_9PROT|nr:nitronate monooxygenase [Hyphomonas adhaerens]KCZ86045.1 2-nitropropane dioxygenase [Hyphomonas adhaerens MHS-3]